MLKIFETLIEKFNTEEKCGFDWKFFATGRQDYSNLINTDKDCDTVIFIFETWTESETRNRANGDQTKVFTLDAFIGFQSELSINFYNESNDDECENKYEKYIEKLEDCLDAGLFNEAICKGDDWFSLSSISKNIRVNYLDQNLDGFKLRLIYSS